MPKLEFGQHDIGKYFWVRFREGKLRDWQPGQVRKTNGMLWVALVYNTAHYELSRFEIGPRLEL